MRNLQITPRVQIIIATARRGALLRRALESVDHERGDWLSGVSVVLNGPIDAPTREVMNDRKSRCEEWIFQEKGLYPGAARNLALRSEGAEWIFFLDDDAYLPPGFDDLMKGILADSAGVDLIGGPNLSPPTSSDFQRAVGRVLTTWFGAWFSHRRFYPGRRNDAATDHDLMLCNLLVRRSALCNLRDGRLGDGRLGDGRSVFGFASELACAEENDLIRRMIAAGSGAHYDPRLWVFHERRTGWRAFTKQVFIYARGRMQANQSSPGGWHLVHVLPSLCALYAAGYASASLLRPLGDHRFLAGLPFLIYAVIGAGFALRLREWRALLLFPLLHLSYGWGFLWEGGKSIGRIIRRALAPYRARDLSYPRV